MSLKEGQLRKDKSHLTAIVRRKPSRPFLWLFENGYINQEQLILDYGCGRSYYTNAKWLNAFGHYDGYDPYFRPNVILRTRYDCVLCIYVLNVIPYEAKRTEVIRRVLKLSRSGVAYFAVRKPKKIGWTLRGTYQGIVTLDFPVIKETSEYIIYGTDTRKH